MEQLKHWFVCLDLSKMDQILTGYTEFLSSVIQPKTITFFHVIKSGGEPDELTKLFPELDSGQELEDLVRDDLSEKVESAFKNSDIEVRVVIKNGHITEEIIGMVKSLNPDLMVLGKKKEYEGEGMIARRIVKYMPCSILFVPETARYDINKILSPVDFSEKSAETLNRACSFSEAFNAKVTAQHIYRYPSHFFPYMPSDKEKETLAAHVQEKKKNFLSKYEFTQDIPIDLTLHSESRIMDSLYDGVVRHQADLILAASKGNKTISSLVRDDFIDKMSFYNFGVPLLILKNKDKHQKFFNTLLDG